MSKSNLVEIQEFNTKNCFSSILGDFYIGTTVKANSLELV